MSIQTIIVDVLIIGIVVLLFVLAWRSVRKNGACSSDCARCHSACSKKGQTPSFVEAYRRDHPESGQAASVHHESTTGVRL